MKQVFKYVAVFVLGAIVTLAISYEVNLYKRLARVESGFTGVVDFLKRLQPQPEPKNSRRK